MSIESDTKESRESGLRANAAAEKSASEAGDSTAKPDAPQQSANESIAAAVESASKAESATEDSPAKPDTAQESASDTKAATEDSTTKPDATQKSANESIAATKESAPEVKKASVGKQDAARSGQPVATVLVDPDLEQEAIALIKSRANPPTPVPESESVEEKSPESINIPDELSASEADRYADSFRPSWEAAEEPGLSELFSTQAAQDTGTDVASRDSDIEALTAAALPVSKDNRRTLLLAGASTAAVALLIWVSISVATQKEETTETGQAGSAATTASPPEAPSAEPEPAASAVATRSEKAPEPLAAATTPEVEGQEAASSQPPVEEMPAAADPTETDQPQDSPQPQAEPEPSASEKAAVEVATAARAPSPRKPVQRNTVHIRVTTSPRSSRLKLDGTSVPNPFDAWVAKGGTHRFAAQADGYIQQSRTVSFDRDQSVSLELPAVEKPAAAARPAPKVRRTISTRPRATRRKRVRRKAASSRKRGASFVTENPY